jgi:hypothetical protein
VKKGTRGDFGEQDLAGGEEGSSVKHTSHGPIFRKPLPKGENVEVYKEKEPTGVPKRREEGRARVESRVGG